MVDRAARVSSRPVGKATTRCPTTTGNSASHAIPIVYGRSPFAAPRLCRNHANAAATISAPVRFAGRRHQASRPVPANDQPTSSANVARSPRSSAWSLASSSATAMSPAASEASPSATSARRRAGSSALLATSAAPVTGRVYAGAAPSKAGARASNRPRGGARSHRTHPRRKDPVMRSSRLALLALPPAVALGAGACGDDDDAATAAEPTPTATAEPASPSESGEDIVAVAQATPQLSTLVDAVTAAELAGTLQGEGPFTVFAPTDDAFAAVGQKQLDRLLRPANRDQLTALLTYHVVPGELTAADLRDGQRLETVQGEQVRVRVQGDMVRVGGATVAQADVDAANGVVHVIDTVLSPPAA